LLTTGFGLIIFFLLGAGIEEDPNAETQHMLDIMRLTEAIYRRPSPVPAFSKS
jgi:hypothetical protein